MDGPVSVMGDAVASDVQMIKLTAAADRIHVVAPVATATCPPILTAPESDQDDKDHDDQDQEAPPSDHAQSTFGSSRREARAIEIRSET